MCAGCIGIQRRVQTQGIVSATILVQFLAPLETDVSAKKHDIHDILEQDCKLARAAAAFLLEFVGQLHVQIEGLALRHDDRRIACTQGYAMAPTLCELFRELAHDGLAALCEVAEKQSLGFAALVVVDGLRRDLQDELSTCHDDGHRSAPFANGSIHAPEHVAGGDTVALRSWDLAQARAAQHTIAEGHGVATRKGFCKENLWVRAD